MSTTATPPQKFIDKDIVFHAAMLLMQSNGQTSSLEVKTHLRGMGYWAKQEKVSAYLQELQGEHSWTKNSPNGYLEYSLANANTGSTVPVVNKVLMDDIIDLIADTINYDDGINLSSNLSIDLGVDHLDIISIAMAIDAKYQIQSVKKDWKDILTVQDVVTLVESLLPQIAQQLPVASSSASSFATGKTPRKARAIINDSLNPSKSPRVTINIDYKRIVIGPTDAKQQCDPNEWFVSNRNSDPVIYDQKYSSDNVRTAYARLKGIKIQDVRAIRVKNLLFRWKRWAKR
jgi:acyl carrier protein